MAPLCEQLRLYVVIDPSMCALDPVDVARGAIDGGATAIQLRVKEASDRESLELAKAFRTLTVKGNVPLIVNDRIDIALASAADGVHLGVDDMPLEAARKMAAAGFVIGYSPEHDEQAVSAGQRGADYLGVGPVYGTHSKSDAGPAIGLETVSRRRALSGLPVVGIGGIDSKNAMHVISAGACGVAVMGAVVRSATPEHATREVFDAVTGVAR